MSYTTKTLFPKSKPKKSCKRKTKSSKWPRPTKGCTESSWAAAQGGQGHCVEQSLTSVLLLQMSLASRTPKDQGMCHVLEQVCSVLKQGS